MMEPIIKDAIVKCQKCWAFYPISKFEWKKDPLFPKEFEYIYCDECKRILFKKVRDINGK
mgnify:CR=1 FL=1